MLAVLVIISPLIFFVGSGIILKSKDEIVEHVQQYVTVEGSKNYVDWHSTDCTGTIHTGR